MSNPIDLLFDSLHEVKTGKSIADKLDQQRANIREDVLEQTEEDTFGGSLIREAANTVMNTADFVDNITPGDMFTEQEREQRKANINLNNAIIGQENDLNPTVGPLSQLAGGTLPYMAAAPLYKAGAQAGTVGLTALLGNNPITRMAGQYAGTAPVTMGVGMAAHDMTPEQAFESTIFDAALSPLGILSKGYTGNTVMGEWMKNRGKGGSGRGPAPENGLPVPPTPNSGGPSGLIPETSHGIPTPQYHTQPAVGKGSSFTGTSQTNRPEHYGKDPNIIVGSEEPLSALDTLLAAGRKAKATVTGEPVNINGPKKAMHIEPKNEVSGEVKDQIDRNNLDTQLLKEDIQEILSRTTNKEDLTKMAPGQKTGLTKPNGNEYNPNAVEVKVGKPNKHLQKDIEHALIKGTMPKSQQAQKVLSELLKSSRYRNKELSFIAHPIAQALNEGKELTPKQTVELATNPQFMNEKQRQQYETINDKKELTLTSTPFDRQIELMEKYGDTPRGAIPDTLKAAMKADPEVLKWQRQITLDNINKQMNWNRSVNEAKAASAKQVTQADKNAREQALQERSYNDRVKDNTFTKETIDEELNPPSEKDQVADDELSQAEYHAVPTQKQLEAEKQMNKDKAPAVKRSIEKIQPKKRPYKTHKDVKKALDNAITQQHVDELVARSQKFLNNPGFKERVNQKRIEIRDKGRGDSKKIVEPTHKTELTKKDIDLINTLVDSGSITGVTKGEAVAKYKTALKEYNELFNESKHITKPNELKDIIFDNVRFNLNDVHGLGIISAANKKLFDRLHKDIGNVPVILNPFRIGAGEYYPASKHIELNQGVMTDYDNVSGKNTLEYFLLHEMAHAATLERLRENPEALKQLDKYYNDAINELGAKASWARSVDEFIAEGISDPKLASTLNKNNQLDKLYDILYGRKAGKTPTPSEENTHLDSPYKNDKDGDSGFIQGSHKKSMNQEPDAKEKRAKLADKLIKDNRKETTEGENLEHDPIHGEHGSEQVEYEYSTDNPARKPDAEATEIFTKPNAKDKTQSVDGYFSDGSVFMDTQTNAAKGFVIYTHESLHKALSREPYLQKLEDAFKEDFIKGSSAPIFNELNRAGYDATSSLIKYEEAVVFVATERFAHSLPDNVKDRLGFDRGAGLSDMAKYYDTSTDNMKDLIDDLQNLLDRGLMSTDNELNKFAYGTDKPLLDRLDDYGAQQLDKLIDKSFIFMKKFEQKAAKALGLNQRKRYMQLKEKADELYHNVMSQASELPQQMFIDKYTAIARRAEETGREVSNVVAGKIKKLVPNTKLREELTPIIIRKDAHAVKDQLLGSRTYADFIQERKTLEAAVKPYIGGKIKRYVDQTIKGLTTQEAMNSPYWKANASQILVMSPRFQNVLKNDTTKAVKATHDLDMLMSMQAITAADFAKLKNLGEDSLSKLLGIHSIIADTAKHNMPNFHQTYIKGYKPTLFKKDYEFTSDPFLVAKDPKSWKEHSEGNWYREKLPDDRAPGMMIDKPQMAKGEIDFGQKHGEANIHEYAEQYGYGVVFVGGKQRLRKVLGDDTRKFMEDNMDLAENMAAMSERNVHTRMARAGADGLIDGLIDHKLVGGKGFGLNSKYQKMSTEQLRIFPKPVKDALIKAFGKDNVYVNKVYKEQVIGYSKQTSFIKSVLEPMMLKFAREMMSKDIGGGKVDGFRFSHNAKLNEMKGWEIASEATNFIKQKIILNNPVVVTGNYMFGNMIFLAEGGKLRDLKRFHIEGIKDFKEYNNLRKKQIDMYFEGKSHTKEYKDVTTRLKNNLAYKLFADGDAGVGGIDRNLLIAALRERNLGKKHMEKAFTDILGGPDSFGYKAMGEIFMTPNSLVGSALIRMLNYVDYLNRSGLVRLYMKQGMSFEEAARRANSKTVSFSKMLPSSLRIIEQKGFDYFLNWSLRNGVGVVNSMKTHPARWAALLTTYFLISEEDEYRHNARYIGDVRVSSFDPAESLVDGWGDGGIYKGIYDRGARAFVPEVLNKVAEGRNPVITTR